MAYAAVHLLVGKGIAEGTGFASGDAFWLGALAPDASHERYGTDSTQGKGETHLYARGDGIAETMAYLRENGRDSFHLGYAAHILTDRLWVTFYKESYPALMLPDGHTDAALYKRDVPWIDQALYWTRLRPTDILQRLARAVPPGDHPLLTADEIGGWRDRNLRQFAGWTGPPKGAPEIMRLEDVVCFIDRAASRITQLLMPQ